MSLFLAKRCFNIFSSIFAHLLLPSVFFLYQLQPFSLNSVTHLVNHSISGEALLGFGRVTQLASLSAPRQALLFTFIVPHAAGFELQSRSPEPDVRNIFIKNYPASKDQVSQVYQHPSKDVLYPHLSLRPFTRWPVFFQVSGDELWRIKNCFSSVYLSARIKNVNSCPITRTCPENCSRPSVQLILPGDVPLCAVELVAITWNAFGGVFFPTLWDVRWHAALEIIVPSETGLRVATN